MGRPHELVVDITAPSGDDQRTSFSLLDLMLCNKMSTQEIGRVVYSAKSSWPSLAADQGGEVVVNQPGLVGAQVIPKGAGQGGGLGVQRQHAFGRPGNGWPSAGLLKCLKLWFLHLGRPLCPGGNLVGGRPGIACEVPAPRLHTHA